MKELVFNLFVYTDGVYIDRLGIVAHEVDGTDEDKLIYLKSLVKTDHAKAEIALVRKFKFGASDGKFKYSSFQALVRLGKSLDIFDELLSNYTYSSTPLQCITVIVNGEPQIDLVHTLKPFYVSDYSDHPIIGLGNMEDYLKKYTVPEGFDILKLINDDYFNAIRILWNSKNYVSCLKLLVSFIDTISFVEYGDIPGNFIKWLNEYSSIKNLGITESQLWEHRNSILHMSNLDSRKVLQGKEKRISYCIARKGYRPPDEADVIYYNLWDLINEIFLSLSKWANTYRAEPTKMVQFIERYDRIVSDSRYTTKTNTQDID